MPPLAEFETDIATLFACVTLVASYYVFLHFKARDNPTYTIHGVNAVARKLWVENVMRNAGSDVMAVQTLRNFVMGASLMASTAALLIIGTLTLSGQAENIAHSWHALSLGGSHATELWTVKVMFLLVVFIVAFFAFAMAVRLANHVVFMVNVPEHSMHYSLSPRVVANRLQRAGSMFTIGMRAFFFAIPLVFWLFGPPFLFAATIGLIVTLFRLDRSDADDASTVDSPTTTFASKPSVISMQAKYANKP